jgi:uncharacterized Zn-binding protein involved in type VI secretion
MAIRTISTGADLNSHGGGALIPSQIKVNCRGIPIILFGDLSLPDANCVTSPIDCAPEVITASLKVFTRGIGVHRRGDKRACGALTIVNPAGNIKVYAG